jgi:hypothetical protein
VANDKKFIVKNGLLTQETVVIGSTTDNGVNKLQVTGSSIFTQATGSTPTINITNSGGTSNSIIAQFTGDSDSLRIVNIGTGDYAILNSQQNNGIRFHDGTSGVEILYNGAVDIDFNSAGIDFKREPSYLGDVFWNAGNDGAGSGLDADLLDGLDSLQFLRSDQDDTFDGNLIITGNLTIQGTTTTINTETVLIADNIITLNSNFTGSTPTENAGIEVERGTLTNSSLVWDELNDWWKLISAGTDLGRIITTADEGSGNGFDADTVDGLQAAQFLRSDANDTATGDIIFQGTITVGNNTAAGALITMDGQAGNRYIFSNNGEIGFLNSAFAYAAHSDAANNWRVLNDTYAKRFIDADNNTYLLDPASTSVLNTIDLEGQIRHNGDTNTYIGFNAADSFEVRTGGSARLTVTNSAVTATQNFVGPRFVDSNNNAYFADPASASVFNTLGIDSDLFHNGDTDNKISFGADVQTFQTGGTTRLTINNTTVTSTVDFVGPRFVDSANLNKFADPAGTSEFTSANFYNGSTTANNEINIGRSATERFNINVTGGQGYIRYYQDETNGTDHSVNFEIISSSIGLNRFNFNKNIDVGSNSVSGAFGVFSSGVYGSVFYDFENELFFADFNNTGNSINMAGTIRGGNGSLAAPTYTFGSDTNTGMYRFGTDTIGFSAGGNDEFRILTTYALAVGQMRSPIFYDSNNTAYYGDFASTSNMNRIDLDDYIRHRGDLDTYFGFSAADTIIAVTANTTRLTINTTGITSTLDVTAPNFYGARFYDSGNVAYYADPASASVFNTLGIDSDLFHNGDTDNKISFGTDTQTFQTGGATRLTINNTTVTSAVNVFAPQYYTNDYLIHNGDTNTYIGFDANDRFGAWTAGIKRINVDTEVDLLVNTNVTGNLDVTGRATIGNSLTRPANLSVLTNSAARIGGSDVHLHIASLSATGNYAVALQSGRQSDNASFPMALQPNGGNVGIGTLTAGSTLTINKTTAQGNNPFAAGASLLSLGDVGIVDFSIRTDSFRNIWNIVESTGQFVFADSGAAIFLAMDAATGDVIIGDQTAQFATPDGAPTFLGALDANKLHVNGGIQLNGIANALSIYAADAANTAINAATFLAVNELGFSAGGGFYMNDTANIRIRNNLTLTSTGDFRAARFVDVNNTNYFADPAGDSQFNTLDIDDYIRHRGDLNTYMGFDAADGMTFVTGGTERFNLDNDSADFSVNVYAPRYYDSNNNAYYGDFASTSNMNRIDLDDYIRHRGDLDTYIGFPSNDSFEVRTGNAQRLLVNNTAVTAVNQMRSPIYYDSANINFYGDFAGTSVMARITLPQNTVGVSHASNANIPTYYIGQQTGDNDAWKIFSESPAGTNTGALIIQSEDDHDANETIRLRFKRTATPFQTTDSLIARFDYVEATGSFRAPTFFDSNNTAFFLDPASSSRLNNISLVGQIIHDGDTNTFLDFNAADSFRVVTGGTTRLTVNNTAVTAASSFDAPIFRDSQNTAYSLNGNTSSAWRISTPTGYVDVGPQNSSFTHFQTDRPKFYFQQTVAFDGAGIEAYDANANAYFPRYFDFNDNFYYGDFDGFSRMNGITFGNPGNGTNTKGRWLSIEGNTDTSGEGSARIFFAEHNSTTASQDLYGAALAYRGGSATVNSATGQPTTLTGLNNGEWGLLGYDNNVNGNWAMKGPRDASFVQARVAFRAPLFVDSNNTAFFVDPASTSITNVMRANQFQIDGSTYIIDSPSGQYGSIRVDGAAGGWAGYAIRDDWVFMANGAENAGIYNDTDNKWAIQFIRNAGTDLLFNAVKQAETENGYFLATNQMRAPIYYAPSSTSYWLDLDVANTSDALRIPGRINRQNFATGNGSTNFFLTAQDRNHFIWNTATNWGIFWATDTAAAYRHVPFVDNMITFVGAGNTRAAIDLDNGNAYFQGGVTAATFAISGGNENLGLLKTYGSGLGDTMLFDATEYWEKRVILPMQGVENNATSVTAEYVKNNNGPFASTYVLRTNQYRTFDSDYIPVEPGEQIYGEIAARYISGTGSLLYMGVRRYDKDKRPIASNDGIEYFVASAVNVTNTGWTTYRSHTTIPTTHTPFNGSDGGGCKYVRVIVLMNYQAAGALREFGPPVLKRANHLSNIVTQNISAEGNITATGNIAASGTVTGTQFIDANNGSYLVDPTGTSVINELRVDEFIRHNGDTNTYLRFIAADDFQIVVGGRQALRMDEGADPDRLRFVTDTNWTDSNGDWNMSRDITVGRIASAAQDMRAPIFYDSNNTGFYGDFASTSVVNQFLFTNSTPLRFNTTSTALFDHESNSTPAAFRMNKGGSTLADTSSYGVLQLSRTNHNNGATSAGAGLYFTLKDSAGTLREYAGIYGRKTVAGTGGGELVFMNYERAEQAYLNSSFFRHVADIRAPRFTDSNNTAFFVDPASTSVTNIVRANQIQIDGSTYIIDSPSGQYGSIRVDGALGGWAGYAIRDDWVFMSNGATNAGIYNDTDNKWAIYFARNSDVQIYFNGTWEERSRSGFMEARGSYRAPIFYDSNNTAYRIDGNGTSRLLTLQVDNPIQGNINGYAETLLRRDNRTISPSADPSGRMRFGFTSWNNNNSSPYADYLHLRSYTDASGGSDNLVSFLKNGFGMRIWQQTWNSTTAYSTFRNVALYNTNPGASNDLYASIFYDSNDTTFRIDPNGTSNIRYLKSNTAGSSSATRALTIKDGGQPEINFGSYPGAWTSALQIQNNNNTDFVWISPLGDGLNARFRTGGSGLDIYTDGGVDTGTYSAFIGSGSVRSPIFYDLNNTAFYGDFAGTSVVNVLDVRGEVYNDGWFRNDTGGRGMYSTPYAQHWYAVGGNDWRLEGVNSTQAIAFATAGNATRGYVYADNGNSIGFLNNGGNWRMQIVSGDWVNIAGSSIRAPIFYDNQDTSYYIDPNNGGRVLNLGIGLSASNGGKLSVTGGHGDSDIRLTALGSTLGSGVTSSMHWWVSEPGVTWNDGGFGYNVDNNGGTPSGFGRPNTSLGQGYMRYSTTGFIYVYNTNTSGTRFQNMEFRPDGFVIANNYLQGGNSLRAPIFYDSNDTNFYSDPNGGSRLNTTENIGRVGFSNYLVSRNEGGMMGSYNATGTADKVIWTIGESWPLGNMYGLAYSYGGFGPFGTQHKLVLRNNGATYTQFGFAGSMYVAGSGAAQNDFRAPIFYDSNNTAYYFNGASLNDTRFEGVDFRTMAMISQPGTNINNSALYRARPRSTSDTRYWTGAMGWSRQDMNVVATWGSGFIDSWSNPPNQPAGTSHWVGVQAFHGNFSNTQNYGWQMVGGPIRNLRFRNAWSGWQAWRTIPVLDINDNNTGAMYAGIYYDSNNTGFYVDPTAFTNLNTGLRATDIYARSWFRNDVAGSGLYNQQTGTHFYSSTGQEWRITGNNDGLAINVRGLSTYNGSSRFWLHGATDGYQGFLNSSGGWLFRMSHNAGLSPGIRFFEAGESWTGNIGSDVGKIEYHANRFYIVSGANSDRIVQFRRDGGDVSWIANDGVFVGTATSARWADLAERYEADAIYEAGTILAIGGDKEVTLYQPGMPVAGAISVKPAYRMNDDDYGNDNSLKSKMNPFIALKGRIPVKINGSAKKGQWIIADKDGKGRAVDYGTPGINRFDIIGIALENGENEVEVKI